MPDEIAEDVKRERERCAKLNEMLAEMHERSAARIRKKGEFVTYAFWPPFKKSVVTHPRWEKDARYVEACAHSLRAVANAIRKGADPDTMSRGF
jgi:hypothetical protein